MPTSCSVSSSACTAGRTSKGRAWDWLPCSASSTSMAAGSGPKRRSIRAPHSSSVLGRLRSTYSRKSSHFWWQGENLKNRIVVARDGEEALDFLFCRGPFSGRSPDYPPKLVLLDLKLPKVDGLQVLREIKTSPGLRAIPVVVLTS